MKINFLLNCSKITKANFNVVVNFLKALKEKLERSGFLLTISIHVSNDFLKNHSDYNFGALSNAVDFLTIIQKYRPTVDYKIGDAIYDRSFTQLELNVEELSRLNVPLSKIVVGLHFGGPKFIEVQANDGKKITKLVKFSKYIDICYAQIRNTKEFQWILYDEASKMTLDKNYVTKETIVYENNRSIAARSKFVVLNQLAGVFTGLINEDDFLGQCRKERGIFKDFNAKNGTILNYPERKENTFPLLRTINDAFKVTLNEILQEKLLRGNETDILIPGLKCNGSSTGTTETLPQIRKPIKVEDQDPNNAIENPVDVNLNTTNPEKESHINGTDSGSGSSPFKYNIHCIILVLFIALSSSNTV